MSDPRGHQAARVVALVPIARPVERAVLGDLPAFVPIIGNEAWWSAFIRGANEVNPGRWREQAIELSRRDAT